MPRVAASVPPRAALPGARCPRGSARARGSAARAARSGRILADDDARIVSVMMPCTIAVYEKPDGSVWAASMNAKLMGKMFGVVVSEVMAGSVAESRDRFLATLD